MVISKLLMVVNNDWFFLSHRKAVAIAALNNGYDVTVVTRDNGHFEEINSYGLKTICLKMNPTGMNIFQEVGTLLFLYKVYKKEKPCIVHHVGPKVSLWGTIAARWAGVPSIVNAVSGLGVIFNSKNIASRCVSFLYKISHRGKSNLQVIFQNEEDKSFYLNKGFITKDKCRFIMGSGIDLKEYTYTPEPDSKIIRICFTARMIKEKGVYEIIESARILFNDYQDRIQFLLCGGLAEEGRTNYISPDELKPKNMPSDYFIWLGKRDDVLFQLQNCHIFIFPSYYNEGLPKSCIEANAVGRPIITTDNVGCRDTVIDGYNGYIIPVKNAKALAEKIKCLIEDKDKRILMGKNARKYAEEHFDLNDVVERHLSIYRSGLIAQGFHFDK